MTERQSASVTFTLTLYFPKVIKAEHVAPAFDSCDGKNILELYAKIVTLIATDEQGKRVFNLEDWEYLLKQDKAFIKPLFTIVDKLLVAFNAQQQSTSVRTSFDYPADANLYVKVM